MQAIGETQQSRAALWITMFAIATHAAWAGVNVWTPIGPYGGYVRALAIDPHNPATLYAGTSGGVFKTTDGGAHWNLANSGLPSGLIAYALAIDPQDSNTIYVGGVPTGDGSGGVFKSTDGATTWRSINSGLSAVVSVVSLAIDPQNPSTVYAGTSACYQTSGPPAFGPGAENLCFLPALFKTTDGGANWTFSGLQPASRTQYGSVGALAIDPQDPSTVYASSNGIFKSKDSGVTWSSTSTLSATALAIDPRNPSTLYALPSSGGILKSTDRAATWTSTSAVGLTNCGSLAIDPSDSNMLYASCLLGLLKSSDGGKTWALTGLPSPRNTGDAGPFYVRNFSGGVVVDPQNPGTVYAATLGLGVFKSLDRANSWNTANLGLSATGVGSATLDPQRPGTIFATANTGLYKTTDGGADWSAAGSGLPATPNYLAVDPQNPNTLYAQVTPTNGINGRPSNGGVFKSTDSGVSWNGVGSPADGRFLYGPLAVDPRNSTVYAGGFGTLFESTDGGANWKSFGSFVNTLTALAIDPQNPDTLYAAIGQVYKSTDRGASWSTLTVPFDSVGDCDECLPVGILAVDPQNSNVVYAAGSVGVLKSVDGGASWTAMNQGLTPWSPAQWNVIDSLVIDPRNSNNVYVAIYGRIFRSTDGAATWSEVSAGLTVGCSTVAINPRDSNTLYAGTYGGGIFAITFIPTTVLQQAVSAMKAYAGADSFNFWQWAWFWQRTPAFPGAPLGFGVLGSIDDHPGLMGAIIAAGGGDGNLYISAEQWLQYYSQAATRTE